jgi:hypothetical protein
MKKMIAAWTAAVAVLASAGSMVAHHSLAQFDTTKAVRVKGVLVMFARVNPHSVVFIDQKLDNGGVERWAVDGPSIIQLQRMGISVDSLKVGEVIEACGYAMKEGVDSQRTLTIDSTGPSLPNSTPENVLGRRLEGELLVMPDGRRQKWSDYGHHLCLNADYHDFHK